MISAKRRSVIVSGLGLVTPLGVNVKENWDNLIKCKSGIKVWEEEKLPIARANPTIEELKRVTSGNPRAQEPRFISLALLACEEALKDSQLTQEHFDFLEKNIAVIIGCGMGSATSEVPAVALLFETPRKISPYFVPRLLPNMAAGNISIKYGFQGPILSPATACASGGHAIAEAVHLIQRGDVEVAICGGTESVLDRASIFGFGRLKALSNKCEVSASRPFDKSRDGFVMGEGAGILVLESEDHFLKRTAKKTLYAKVSGVGMSGDAYHVTSPNPNGIGAELAMKRALKDANLNKVDYINAHATSTPLGDEIEAKAISRVSPNAAVSSTKGATGHLLGAAGAVEAAFTILSLYHQTIPPTLHLSQLDPDIETLNLDFVINEPRLKQNIKSAISNSFGFGGTNVSLVFEKAN